MIVYLIKYGPCDFNAESIIVDIYQNKKEAQNTIDELNSRCISDVNSYYMREWNVK